MIEKFVITGDDGSPYLTRYTLIRRPKFAVRLHHFHRPDSDACPHDHPWWFCSLVLWGGYAENIRQPDGAVVEQVNRFGRFLWRPKNFAHTVTRLLGKTCWTLVVTGPDGGEWGFFTRGGWMHWKTFVYTRSHIRALWCRDNGKET
jgi:hypothetical protein